MIHSLAHPTARPTLQGRLADAVESPLCLVVVGDDRLASFPLPASGSVTIGRSSDSEICIDAPHVSRLHAVLYLDELAIQDLGSANGTRVRGSLLGPGERRAIAPGEAVEIESIMMIVQRREAPVRARRLWSHDYFEGRLESECARAEAAGSAFAVLRVHADQRDALRAQQLLAEVTRPVDVFGLYGPGEYELLLVDQAPGDAARVAGKLEARLRGAGLRVGVAHYPADGRSPDALVARACAALRGGDGQTANIAAIVEDPAMRELHRLIDRVARGAISVLLLGETGVGKEILAETVHRASPRAGRPLLRLNCAALSESLLESELFGHEKGAFTGAVATKPGLLESADGGTVFLDEIGELPMSLQVKLLRVLEDRRVRRVGALDARPIDVRFVAATNRDLECEVAAGRFREDLYYRLAGMTLQVPPLRRRHAEIEPLARSFAERAAERLGGARPRLSSAALSALTAYSWPGNIRELRNAIDRAVLLAGDGPIGPEHLPLEKMRATLPVGEGAGRDRAPSVIALASPGAPTPTPIVAPEQARRDPECERILDALAQTGGNQTRAAKLLGISRRTMVNRLNQYGIARPRKSA